MGGSEHAPLHFKRSLEQQLRLGAFALAEMVPLAREGGGEIRRSHERLRMLRSQHALVHGEHLAVDPLGLGMLPLAREGGGEIDRRDECARMIRSQHALVYGEHLAPVRREVNVSQSKCECAGAARMT